MHVALLQFKSQSWAIAELHRRLARTGREEMHERPHLDPGMLTVLGQNGELLRGMILSFPGRGLKCEMDTTTLYLSALRCKDMDVGT